jgi:sugar lactone lactonase YvrE
MQHRFWNTHAGSACLGVAALALALTCSQAAGAADNRTEVTFPGARAYPESITATSDGALIAGSLAEGGIFRVPPGASTAEIWIPPDSNDSMSTLGVLADERAGTLWVCSSNLAAFGVPPPGGPKPVALKGFDLKTGAAKGSYPLPGNKTLCNDMAVGRDGSIYVTDSFQPHVLVLRPGSVTLDAWAEHPGFGGEGANLNGIAIGADGNVYVNTFGSGRLFRIAMGEDGKSGRITQLKPSQPIDHPDGLRAYATNGLLMVEGAGRFDIVRLADGDATIEVVKDGFKGPVSVVQVGGVAWVLEAQLDTLFNAEKAGKPRPFHAYAVPLPR